MKAIAGAPAVAPIPTPAWRLKSPLSVAAMGVEHARRGRCWKVKWATARLCEILELGNMKGMIRAKKPFPTDVVSNGINTLAKKAVETVITAKAGFIVKPS
jgi:hypothetical protein